MAKHFADGKYIYIYIEMYMVGAILHADAIVSCQLGEFLTAQGGGDTVAPRQAWLPVVRKPRASRTRNQVSKNEM